MTPDLRALAAELAPSAGAPLLPGRRVGWLPHLLVAVLAVVLAGVAWHTLIEDFGVPNQLAGALAVGQAVALPLALSWPLAGWWLSLILLVGAAWAAEPEGGAGPLWPGPELVIHLCVLALVALGVRARVSAALWSLTLLAGLALTPLLPGRDGLAGTAVMALFSGAVLVAVGALRGRAEALRRLRTEERAGTLLAERARIARELHDVVAHHLSVIAIQAEGGPHRPAGDLPRVFGTIRGNALDAMTELHRVLELLRRPGEADLAPQPSLDRLDDLLAGVRGTGLAVAVRTEGARRPLPEGFEVSAYRIVQEALSNVLRHAPDAAVEVVVSYRPAELALEVVNGPPPGPRGGPRPPGGGHGIVGMRERAAMLGGELSAGPAPGGGYTVRAVLPVPGGHR